MYRFYESFVVRPIYLFRYDMGLTTFGFGLVFQTSDTDFPPSYMVVSSYCYS